MMQGKTVLITGADGDIGKNTTKGIGNGVASGICHSFTEDGRCVSLFKILMTNNCIYDCAYCINRRTNDRPRATFTIEEIVELTLALLQRIKPICYLCIK